MARDNVPLTAGILVGGESRRMGKDKALLDIAGEPLVARMIRAVSAFADEVLVAARDPAPYRSLNARVVQDRLSPSCALAGVHAVLSGMKKEAAFVCAVDMPWISTKLINFLRGNLEDYDGVVPRTGRGLEPLYAIYTRRCLPAIEETFEQGRLAVPDFYSHCRIRVLPVDESRWSTRDRSPFANLNTPEDYDRFLRTEDPRNPRSRPL